MQILPNGRLIWTRTTWTGRRLSHVMSCTGTAVCLLGLKNASAAFQRAMDIVQAPIKLQPVVVYIHTVVIYFEAQEEPLNDVEILLQLSSKAGMTLKLRKCFFFSGAIDNLGHVITPRQLHFATKTTGDVRYLTYLSATIGL